MKKLIGVMIILNIIKNWDNKIIDKIGLKDNTITNRIMIFFTRLGNYGIIWGIFAIASFFNHEKSICIKIFIALFFSTVIGEITIKRSVARLRPSHDIHKDDLLIKKPNSYSFPSGHTTSSFSSAGIIALYLPILTIPVIALAAIISYSRIYLKVHYPSDVIAGALIGIILSLLIDLVF